MALSKRFEFSGADMARLRGPLVYVVFRGGRAIYVGRSFRGAARPFDCWHHVPILPDDHVLILAPDLNTPWMVACKEGTEKVVAALEMALIALGQPELNDTGKRHIHPSARSLLQITPGTEDTDEKTKNTVERLLGVRR